MNEQLKQLETLLEVSLLDEPNTSSIINTALEQVNNLWGQLDESDKRYIFSTLRDIVRVEEVSARETIRNCETLLDNISYTQQMLG